MVMVVHTYNPSTLRRTQEDHRCMHSLSHMARSCLKNSKARICISEAETLWLAKAFVSTPAPYKLQ